MNLDNLKLEAGLTATCEASVTVPRKVILCSFHPPSLPFSPHSLVSSYFFPCNVSLNLENVKHRKAFPSSSRIFTPERGHLELEFSIADTHYLSSGLDLRPRLLVNGAALTLPQGIPESRWALTLSRYKLQLGHLEARWNWLVCPFHNEGLCKCCCVSSLIIHLFLLQTDFPIVSERDLVACTVWQAGGLFANPNSRTIFKLRWKERGQLWDIHRKEVGFFSGFSPLWLPVESCSLGA